MNQYHLIFLAAAVFDALQPAREKVKRREKIEEVLFVSFKCKNE
jgi:hypothetical protein